MPRQTKAPRTQAQIDELEALARTFERLAVSPKLEPVMLALRANGASWVRVYQLLERPGRPGRERRIKC